MLLSWPAPSQGGRRVPFQLRYAVKRVSVPSDVRGIHCGCEHCGARGSCCGTVSGSGAGNGICTSVVAAGSGHRVWFDQRTSRPGYVFHSISFRPAIGPHPRRHACLRIQQRQSLGDCGQPRRYAGVHICRRRSRFRASMPMSPDFRRKPCTAGPTHGSVPFYANLLEIEIHLQQVLV